VRALLIVNPNATSTTRAARDLLAHALESRVQLVVAHTEHRGHAAELAQWATSQRMDLIVVHGGDGTVNEAINGMLPAPEVIDGAEWTPRLAVLPGGSANVFARSLGIDSDPVVATNQLIDLLSLGYCRRIGLGHADGRWFTFNAGMGWDAEVCEAVDRCRDKGHSATAARYVRIAVRRFFAGRRQEPALTVELPGRAPITGVHYAMVSNSSPWTYLGARPVRTNPDTSFDTGLGVFAMRTMRLGPTLRTVRQLLSISGGPESSALLRSDDVASVRIRADRPIGLQMDGDYLGTRRVVDFTARPAAVQVVAPKNR
jgi:diacylglycerol kinase family enzyme